MKCYLESLTDLIHEKKDLIRGNFGNEIFKWNVTNAIAIATFVTQYVLQVIQRNGNYEELVRIDLWQNITNYTIATFVTHYVLQVIQWNGNYENLLGSDSWQNITNYTIATFVTQYVFSMWFWKTFNEKWKCQRIE